MGVGVSSKRLAAAEDVRAQAQDDAVQPFRRPHGLTGAGQLPAGGAAGSSRHVAPGARPVQRSAASQQTA